MFETRTISAKTLRPRGHTTAIAADSPAHVWILDAAGSNAHSSELIHALAPEELHRARKYHRTQDRDWFIERRGMLRVLAGFYLGCPPGELRFSTDGFGKPSLQRPSAPLSFSVTQTGGVALLAFAWGCRIGIDAERVTDGIDRFGVAREVFSSSEQEAIINCSPQASQEVFFRTWVRKEAFLKALGTGFSLEPKAVTTSNDSPTLPHRWRGFLDGTEVTGWTLLDLDTERDLKIALAVSCDDSPITVRNCASLGQLRGTAP